MNSPDDRDFHLRNPAARQLSLGEARTARAPLRSRRPASTSRTFGPSKAGSASRFGGNATGSLFGVSAARGAMCTAPLKSDDALPELRERRDEHSAEKREAAVELRMRSVFRVDRRRDFAGSEIDNIGESQ